MGNAYAERKILAYENSERKKLEEEKRIQYNPDNLFKKQEAPKYFEEQVEETAMVEYKENFF